MSFVFIDYITATASKTFLDLFLFYSLTTLRHNGCLNAFLDTDQQKTLYCWSSVNTMGDTLKMTTDDWLLCQSL